MSCKKTDQEKNILEDGLSATSSRRTFLKGMSIGAAAASAALVTGCVPVTVPDQ